MKYLRFVVLALVFLTLVGNSFAITQLINLQGRVTDSAGDLVNNGNVMVYIFNASTGGDPIYNSTTNFNSEVNNGVFNVMLGSTTALDLDYGTNYWLDLEINNDDIDWSGSERMSFASATGEITGSAIATSNETATFHVLDGGGKALNITQADDEAAISVAYSGSGDGAINITSTNTGPALYIDQGSYPDYGAVYIDNTKSSGMGLYIYSNYGSGMHDALLKLYADNAAFDVPVLYIDNDGAEDALYIENEGSNFGLNVNNTFVVNNTLGTVGIGTVIPTVTLDVNGTLRGTEWTSPTTGIGVEIGYDIGNDRGAVQAYSRTDSAWKDLLVRAANVSLDAAGTTRMFIRADGNVGIGTSSPGTTLDVNGRSRVTATGADPTSGSGLEMIYHTANDKAYILAYDRTGSAYKDISLGVSDSQLYLNSDGKVGIGTASPTSLLDIAGATATLKVNASDLYPLIRFQNSVSKNVIGLQAEGFNIWDSNDVIKFHFNYSDSDVAFGGCTDPDHDFIIGGSGAGCNTGSYSEIDASESSFATSSSRTIKENFKLVDGTGILEKVEDIPVYTFDFIDGPKDKMGLIAEDFYTVFGRGSDKILRGPEVDMAMWLAIQELKKENDELKSLVCLDHPGAEVCQEGR